MKLDKKKELAAKVLKVGKRRIIFAVDRLQEIKEAITKQDIKDLKNSGAIRIREKQGRRKVIRRKTKRGEGKIKRTINRRKQDYVKITRKLRAYTKEMKKLGKINLEEYYIIRKKIKAREFKNKSQLKEYLKAK